FGRIGNRAEESAGLAGGSEFVGGEFVAHKARRAVESHAKINFAHALIVGPKTIVGAHSVEVSGRVHKEGLGHCGAGRILAAIDEELAQQRATARDRRRGMAGAGGGRVELLVEGEEIVGIVHAAAAGKRTDASSLEAGDGAAGAGRTGRGTVL